MQLMHNQWHLIQILNTKCQQCGLHVVSKSTTIWATKQIENLNVFQWIGRFSKKFKNIFVRFYKIVQKFCLYENFPKFCF